MTGKIYFVSAPGRIKIGYTKKPEIRLAQLRSVDMEELTTIAVVDGTRYAEKKLHGLILEHRIRGEWFNDCPEVRGIIDEFVGGKLAFDQPHDPLREQALDAPVPVIDLADYRNGVVAAAIKESFAICEEVSRRIGRGESVAELAHQALFLAKHVIGPAIHGPDKMAALLAVEIAPEIIGGIDEHATDRPLA